MPPPDNRPRFGDPVTAPDGSVSRPRTYSRIELTVEGQRFHEASSIDYEPYREVSAEGYARIAQEDRARHMQREASSLQQALRDQIVRRLQTAPGSLTGSEYGYDWRTTTTRAIAEVMREEFMAAGSTTSELFPAKARHQTSLANLESLLAKARATQSPWMAYGMSGVTAVLHDPSPSSPRRMEFTVGQEPQSVNAPYGRAASTMAPVSIPIIEWSHPAGFEEALAWAFVAAGASENIGSWEHLAALLPEAFRHVTGSRPNKLVAHPKTIGDIVTAGMKDGPAFFGQIGLSKNAGHTTFCGVEMVPSVYMEKDCIVLCAGDNLGTVFVRGERRAGVLLHASSLRTYRLARAPQNAWTVLVGESLDYLLDG